LDGPAIFECNVKSRLRGFEIVHRAGELLARDKGVGFALMPEWMATRILALLLGLSEVSPQLHSADPGSHPMTDDDWHGGSDGERLWIDYWSFTVAH
jgi:hypothetical protein